MQYRADNNDKFPLVAVNENIAGSTPAQPMPAYGWADALYPYIEGGMEIYHCPRGSSVSYRPKEKNYTDYWFNTNMSALRQSILAQSAQTFTLGEGNDGDDLSNARYSKGNLTTAWLNSRNSPSSRHQEGANYAFADGHVKWLKPNQVSIGSSGTYKFTAK